MIRTFYVWILGLCFASPLVHADEPSGEDYYYGFDVKQDYQKAYQLFKKEKYYLYLIIMQLNGEIAGANLEEAQNIFAQWTKGSNNMDSTQSEVFHILKQRRAESTKEYRKLGLCDFAMTTMDMNYCTSLENRIAEKKAHERVSQLMATLSPKAQKYLSQIEHDINIIKLRDADCTYLDYMDGTIRRIAYNGSESYINHRHQERLEKLLEKRILAKFSQEDLKQADKELNRVYQQRRTGARELFKERQEYGSEEDKEIMENLLKEYLSHLKTSQIAWISYRDHWVQLLLIHQPKGFSSEQAIKTAIATLLTTERTAELLFDPVGPGE